MKVSFIAYKIAKKTNLDINSIARGGLLHDFFLYDWRGDRFRRKDFKQSHAFRHPIIALNNSEKYFELNEIERDIIVKHMWPATLQVPRYRESMLVCMVDKYVASKEYVLLRPETEQKMSAAGNKLAR